jgi:hypothetical protein
MCPRDDRALASVRIWGRVFSAEHGSGGHAHPGPRTQQAVPNYRTLHEQSSTASEEVREPSIPQMRGGPRHQ